MCSVPVYRYLLLAAIFVGSAGTTPNILAQSPRTATTRSCRCPHCDKFCAPIPAPIKEKQTFYACETKEVCLPAVSGPYSARCDAPRCGQVRTVKVLHKLERECEHCGYHWHIYSSRTDSSASACATCGGHGGSLSK